MPQNLAQGAAILPPPFGRKSEGQTLLFPRWVRLASQGHYAPKAGVFAAIAPLGRTCGNMAHAKRVLFIHCFEYNSTTYFDPV
ncbi:hypothetical protein CSC82_08940 [Rhodobacteraceae bacterium 4F10]|nr:hypothetical protein CSC82_08940 [Rhodobacteraceae bacterium 4F10]